MQQSEFNQGASYARDSIMANIIGMQNDEVQKEGNPKYDVLQELLEHVIKTYGDFSQPFKG